MKRRRHDIVELSSDDSLDDDFVPAKLKSKRVSIVLSKNPVSLTKLKTRQNASANNCKNSEEVQYSTLAGSIKTKRGRGRPKRVDISKITSLPRHVETSEKSENQNVKLKPQFSDLDDSLLIESLMPGSSKINPNQGTLSENTSDSLKQSKLSISDTLNSTENATVDNAELQSLKTQNNSYTPENETETQNVSFLYQSNTNTDTQSQPGPSCEPQTNTGAFNKKSKEVTSTRQSQADSLGYSFCQICQKNISGYSTERRRSHVNKCCDQLERANNFGGSRSSVNSQGGRSVPSRVNCPLCPKNYSDKNGLKKHLKSCCIDHGKCFETVCEVFLSAGKNTVEIVDGKKQTTKKSKSKEKKPTALQLENRSAINAAQNKILDIIAEQDTQEIPATPALKISHLTTYRSKRNSIWNVAGSATTTVSNVLAHDKSLINTPPPQVSLLESVPPLTASVPDDPICLEKSSLPSQADITHLTQFLTELGKDDSVKERLTSLMLSPSKTSQKSVETSQESVKSSQKSVETCQESMENSGVAENKTRGHGSVEKKVIQVQNSFKSKPLSSPSITKKPCKISSVNKSRKPLLDPSENQNIDVEESDQTTENHSFDNEPEPKIENENVADISKSPHVTLVTDRSPNPSEISAVDNSTDVRTPVRGTSEMVSSIRDAESSLPDQSSVQEDSNLDLFGEEAGPGTRREVYDRSPDRSLLNVSPITDSGINEVDVQTGPNGKIKDKKRQISPIYRPIVCSSTTRDSVAITVPVALSNKNIQVGKETKSLAVGTDLRTRAKASNTDMLECRSVSCNTATLDKAAVQCQADGDNRLTAMMQRLSQHTPSTDITLLCSDWKEKRAHRVILTVSCPALLDCCDPQSSEDNPVVKLDIGSEAADMFLEYVYTQKIESEVVGTVVLSELFDIAERLDMTELTNHLHTKRTETIELEFEQESGVRILLNLSAQDVVNLSQQIELVSSQNKSIVSLENTFQQDIPSFQEHDVFPVPSPTDCGTGAHIFDQDLFNRTESGVHILDQDLFNGTGNPTSPVKGGVSDDKEQEENNENGADGSDCDDLPASGIVLDEKEEPTAMNPSPPSPEMTEEDRRASQLIQDVEFIDLVKKLDVPVVDSPLSFIDDLSPLNLTTDKDISLINLDCQTPGNPSGKPTGTSGIYQSTPDISKNRRNVRRSLLDTPSNLELSEYNKTPNFKGMDTPKLKAEVGKYGLKPLSKKRAVAKLEEIHRFTNKKFLKCPLDTDTEPTSSAAKSNKQKERTSRSSSSKQSTKERKRRNSSSSSSSEKNCPVGDISVSEKLPKSASREVSEQVRSVIRSREDLHCQVLTYTPIDIIEIKGLLKRRTSVGLIAQVLDDLGITYFNSETKAKGFRKGNKKPKK
ncbi:hypothetical protein ACHWQZ_G009141 [Mnemiopsis leidyi]